MENRNFRNFVSIKKSIEQNREIASKNKHFEVEWGHYDSSLNYVAVSFFGVLPDKYKNRVKNIAKEGGIRTADVGDVFKEYIIDKLIESKKENLKKKFYGVEFGGPGSQFFEEFEGFFDKTAGICLKDIRGKEQKEIDESNKHYVISGDFMDPFNSRPYIDILHKIKRDKVDFIISRMQGPLNEINKNPVVLHNIFNKWYRMLDENGLMFVQFDYLKQHDAWLGGKKIDELKNNEPSALEKRIKAWAEVVTTKYPEVDLVVANGTFKLHKNFGAPKEIADVRSEVEI